MLQLDAEPSRTGEATGPTRSSARGGVDDHALNHYHVAIDAVTQLADAPCPVRAHLGAVNVQLARPNFAATAEHIAAAVATPASPQDVVVLRARLAAG